MKEGKQTADKISLVAKQFLQLEIPTLGFVVDDSSVSKAVKKQVPFTVAYPHSEASKGIHELANRFIAGRQIVEAEEGGVKGFLTKMIRLLK
jgi:flagellar biosynthesis protein FlhG